MPTPPRPKSVPSARALAKLLDNLSQAVWVVDSAGRLIWINRPCGEWLKVEPTSLLGRIASASSLSDDPLDCLAAALAPPLGLDREVVICANCEPENVGSRLVRYLRIGDSNDAVVVASTGPAVSGKRDADIVAQNQIHDHMHRWRKRDAVWGGIAAAGSSKAAQRLREQVKLATGTIQNLSIVGPEGCGGEVIARRIHAITSTAKIATKQLAGPFVAIDGSLMDTELLEASLSPAAAYLGDERIEHELRPCTLLIRGLDETPLDVQNQLEHFLTAHGDSLRMIGLLSKSVSQATAEDKLIASLASKLDVLSLRVEPFADRVEDIPIIASALIDSRHAAGGGTAERLNRAALDRLLLYPWPGNFDELDAAMRQAMAACNGLAIGPEHLPLVIRSYLPGEPSRLKEPIEKDLDLALTKYELRLINAALEAADGNRSEAARMLGISRARLLRRIDESQSGTQ